MFPGPLFFDIPWVRSEIICGRTIVCGKYCHNLKQKSFGMLGFSPTKIRGSYIKLACVAGSTRRQKRKAGQLEYQVTEG